MSVLKKSVRLCSRVVETLVFILAFSTYSYAVEDTVELSPSTPSLMENFTQGHIAYNAGNYKEAIDYYLKCLSEAQSVELNYNLGNSYYQNGDVGRAVLHYQKALALEPQNPEVRKNLKFVYTSVDLQNNRSGLLSRWATLCSIDTWTWLMTLGFWTSCTFILLLWLFRLNRSPIRYFFLFTSLITVLSLVGLLGSYTVLKQGVVLNNETPLKISPTENSPQSAVLQAGVMAMVKKKHLGWFYIIGPNNKTGWISDQDFQKIWD